MFAVAWKIFKSVTGMIWIHFAERLEEGTQIRVAWRLPSLHSGHPCGAASDGACVPTPGEAGGRHELRSS